MTLVIDNIFGLDPIQVEWLIDYLTVNGFEWKMISDTNDETSVATEAK